MNRRGQHLVHRLGLFLLDEHHGQMHQIAYEDGRSNARGLNRNHLVDGFILEKTDKLLGNLHHQVRVHLMIDKTIHFQDAAGIALAILHDTRFQYIHNYLLYLDAKIIIKHKNTCHYSRKILFFRIFAPKPIYDDKKVFPHQYPNNAYLSAHRFTDDKIWVAP